MNYKWKNMTLDQEYKYQEKARLVIDFWKQERDVSTTGVDESEEQCPPILYLYLYIYFSLLDAQAISMVVA
jgi:hypothetical protein